MIQRDFFILLITECGGGAPKFFVRRPFVYNIVVVDVSVDEPFPVRRFLWRYAT